MYYTNDEMQEVLDEGMFLIMEAMWMRQRNEMWLENLIHLCHTGKQAIPRGIQGTPA